MRTARLVFLAVLAVLGGAAPAARAQQDERLYRRRFEDGLTQLRARDYDASIETFQVLVTMAPERPEPFYNMACAHALRGSYDEAVTALEAAIQRGFRDGDHIDRDGDLDALRGDPRFHALMHLHFGRTPPGPPLRTLAGDEAPLEKLQGRVVVMLFWRTDSAPCREAAEHLVRLHEELAPRGLTVLGISPEEAARQESAADELLISFPLLRRMGPMPPPFVGILGFPTLFVVGADGELVARFDGFDVSGLERAIEAALPQPAAPAPGQEVGGSAEPPTAPRPPAAEPQVF